MSEAVLPSRLSEKSFRKYEHDIAKIANSWPSVVILRPTKGSITTYVARLRDAILSLSQHRWPSTLVSQPIFDRIHPQLVVSHRGDCAMAGPRNEVVKYDKPDEPMKADAFTATPHSSSAFDLQCFPYDAVKVVCHLASKRLLVGPVKVFGLSSQQAGHLEESYDVALTLNADNSYTIV
jgi:hypothetical protein